MTAAGFTIGGVTDRRANPNRARLEEKGLYHSFLLPDGRTLEGLLPRERLERRLDAFGIPGDLTGLRVLDIGPWDGYCTFALEQRGAAVTAIDYVDLDTFRILHRAYGSRAEYLHLDVYQLDPRVHGRFDIVLCFGVLYHLKHPLLALERICAVTGGVCHIDSFALDPAEHFAGARPAHPYAEFYPRDELAGQLDNWTGPTVGQVEAWARTAGFAWTELRGWEESTVWLSAHRRWPERAATAPPVSVAAVSSHRHRGASLVSAREEYLCVWCEWSGETPALEEVCPLVDEFGVAPLYCHVVEQTLTVSLPLPPGLAPGRHEVRLRVGERDWSAPVAFYIDLPAWTAPVELLSVQDALTFAVGEATARWLTCWVRGLSPEADVGNTVVTVGGVPHCAETLEWRAEESAWQLNVRLRAAVPVGEHAVTVEHRGAVSHARDLRVTTDGERPRGLEGVR